MGTVVVLITAPRGKGAEIARRILEERLAACVNIVSVGSMYWWRGKLEEDEEDLLIVKTCDDTVERLIDFVKRIHPYEVPEVIALPVVKGLEEYLAWVASEVRGCGESRA